MGLFDSISNVIGSITDPIGSLINGVTGSTNSAKQTQKYNLQSAAQEQKYNVEAMKLQNQFQKEFAKNAHQWEVNDLMKAGYNPALTTGLGGATTGGAGGGTGASVNSANVQPGGGLGSISDIVNLYNQTSATRAQAKQAEADAELKQAQTIKQIMDNEIFKKYGDKQALQDLLNALAEGKNIEASTYLAQMQAENEGKKGGLITEQTNTERSRRGQIDAQTINTIKNTETVDMNNYILQKDVDMLKKYGISRSEIKEIGGGLFKEIMGMFRAGKYAEAAKMIKNSKKGK